VTGAQKYVAIVETSLDTLISKPTGALALSVLQTKIQKEVDSTRYPAFFISNFVKKDTANSLFFDVIPPTLISDKLAPLDGVSSWSRDRVESLVKNKLSKGTRGLNIYPFIVQGAFASHFQIGIILFLLAVVSLIFITQGIYYYHTIIKQRELQAKQDALQRQVKEGKEASPVWELAQLTLTKYYTRNLSQNNWIFYVSVSVMIAGFALVLYGIALAYDNPKNILVTTISAGSGVIVQFIGATFLVIYKSTISQSIEYTASLQKVSTVGTSIKILDSIKEDETEDMRKDKEYIKLMMDAKIAIAKLLIEQSNKSK
jgi:hypothetical protein